MLTLFWTLFTGSVCPICKYTNTLNETEYYHVSRDGNFDSLYLIPYIYYCGSCENLVMHERMFFHIPQSFAYKPWAYKIL